MVKNYDKIFSDEQKEKMREEYLNGCSIRDIAKKYNVKSNQWIHKKLLNGVCRTMSQAGKLSHKRYPERFLHSEETKEKIRQNRLRFMKEHPEETAWRKRNEPSYPEKCFIKFLTENGYDKKFLIEREKSVFPYYIDFAFLPIKLAIEIDGSQHVLEAERRLRDEDKDKTLISNGWKVLRVTENLVKTDWVTLKKKIDELIGSNNITIEKVGIFNAQKTRKKVERGADGLSIKMRENNYRQRKVKDRPSYSSLKKLLETNSMVKIGKMFNVSDKTIKKWLLQYEKLGNLE